VAHPMIGGQVGVHALPRHRRGARGAHDVVGQEPVPLAAARAIGHAFVLDVVRLVSGRLQLLRQHAESWHVLEADHVGRRVRR
jgi:hypothetical protein